MPALVSKGFVGAVTLQKTGPASGGGPLAVGTEQTVPVLEFDPRDPTNVRYPAIVNKAAFPTVSVVGKRTPSVNIRTALMSWATANFLNSLILSTDANGDTDQFAVRDFNGSQTRIYDRLRCASLTLRGANGGGPIGLEFGGPVTTAQGGTSFVSTAAPVTGSLYTSAAIDFGATGAVTADLVRRWQLTLTRSADYQSFCDNTLYAADTVSGPLTGTLRLEQSDLATKVPGASVTIRIFPAVGASVPALTITAKLSSDEARLSHDTGFGNLVNLYTLIDTAAGGTPVTIA